MAGAQKTCAWRGRDGGCRVPKVRTAATLQGKEVLNFQGQKARVIRFQKNEPSAELKKCMDFKALPRSTPKIEGLGWGQRRD